MPELMRKAAAFGASAWLTGRLLLRGQLSLPATYLGWWLEFHDGSRLRVYRETVRTGAPTDRPALLVVRFRLRLLGRGRLWHALFRAESLLNTPLFAGFPGFRSKLWATNPDTGAYRGVYQWDGADRAEAYATTLLALLRPLCRPGSLTFHVEPGVWLGDLLRAPAMAAGDEDRWWRLRLTTRAPEAAR